MRNFTRSEEPEILKNNWERIGADYASKRAAKAGHAFQWPQINNQKLNHLILPLLKQQTQTHCSYCDRSILFTGDDSIDHFKPKSDERFYTLVSKWDNLYLCCNHCQRAKTTIYDETLLRPDAEDYSFNRYFVYNYISNEIDVNPDASPGDRRRAEATIQIFKLNDSSFNRARKKVIKEFKADNDFIIDEYQFRFLFD